MPCARRCFSCIRQSVNCLPRGLVCCHRSAFFLRTHTFFICRFPHPALSSLKRRFSGDSLILFLLCFHAGLTSGNLDISGFALANGILCTHNNVLHESAFMQTFCLLEELPRIGGTDRSILQTGDKAFESQPRKTWIVRLGAIFGISLSPSSLLDA